MITHKESQKFKLCSAKTTTTIASIPFDNINYTWITQWDLVKNQILRKLTTSEILLKKLSLSLSSEKLFFSPKSFNPKVLASTNLGKRVKSQQENSEDKSFFTIKTGENIGEKIFFLCIRK